VPTYEYACRGCGEHREVVQSFSDAALTTCESCGGELRKVFSAAGLIFKGSGWHIKDYAGSTRTASRAGATGSTDGSGDAGAGSGGASSDAPASGASSPDSSSSTAASATASSGTD